MRLLELLPVRGLGAAGAAGAAGLGCAAQRRSVRRWLHRLVDEFDYVADGELAVVPGRLDGVLETGRFIWAGDRQHPAAVHPDGGHGLAHATLGQAFRHVLRHESVEPHPATATAAAVAVRLVVGHLGETDPRDRLEQEARSLVLAVVATREERIVIGHAGSARR